MPIPVTCPKCHARFQVSEKFAGKKGPCPKCKTPITIPKLDQQVQVDDRAHGGTKDAAGKLVLKPIERKETKVRPVILAAIGLGVIASLAIAWVLGSMYDDKTQIPWFILAGGAFVVGIPVAAAGYGFLRNDELEPHTGAALWVRALIYSATGVILWMVYYGLVPPAYRALSADPLFGVLVLIPFVAIGIGASLATFDLDIGSAVMHFVMYLIACIILCVTMGWPMIAPGDAAETKEKAPETIRVPQFGR